MDMDMENIFSEFNFETLENATRNADNHESYQMLAHGDNFRLGLSMTISEEDELISIMEFLFCVLKYHSEVERKSLEKALNVSDIMMKRGYSLFHQDDGWIICEKRLEKNEIQNEIEFMRDLVIKFHKIWNGKGN
jgi:uncharacterized protein YjaG (DUF416 family)